MLSASHHPHHHLTIVQAHALLIIPSRNHIIALTHVPPLSRATPTSRSFPGGGRSAPLPAYARAMPCPVLT
eukprot:3117923-Rhodomonas_salina.1